MYLGTLHSTLKVRILRFRPVLRSVHEASSTQVENHGRVYTQVLFLRKEELGFFSLSRNSDRQAGYLLSTSLAGTFHRRRPRLLKTGFFRQVRELKNPGSALCLKKNVLRYMLFEVGGKEQESIHYQLQKNLSYVYVCMCVCVCILIVDVVYVMGFELLQMQILLS